MSIKWRLLERKQRKQNHVIQSEQAEHMPTGNMTMTDKPCVFCGRKYCKGKSKCAAWGRMCRVCGKKNHFASQCKAKEKTHNIKVEEEASSEEEFMYCVTTKPAMTETVNSVSEQAI